MKICKKKEKIDRILNGYFLTEALDEDFTDLYYITDLKYSKRKLNYKVSSHIMLAIQFIILALHANMKGARNMFEFWIKELFANLFATTVFDVLKKDNSYENRVKFIDYVYDSTDNLKFEYFQEQCTFAAYYDKSEYEWNINRRNLDIPAMEEIVPTEELFRKYLKVFEYYKDCFANMKEITIDEFVEEMREI